MLPFPRAKLQGENLEQFATQAAVARAKREAMDYTDDMFARTAKGVQEDGRKPATTPSPSYFFRAQQEIADLREENARLVARCVELAKENDALHLSLTEKHLRLATIRSKAERVPQTRLAQSWSVHDLVDEACR